MKQVLLNLSKLEIRIAQVQRLKIQNKSRDRYRPRDYNVHRVKASHVTVTGCVTLHNSSETHRRPEWGREKIFSISQILNNRIGMKVLTESVDNTAHWRATNSSSNCKTLNHAEGNNVNMNQELRGYNYNTHYAILGPKMSVLAN